MYATSEEHITLTPLNRALSFKEVLPLQLADFMASEVKKSNEDLADWQHSRSVQLMAELGIRAIAIGPKTPSHWSGERHSLVKLIEAAPVHGRLWDYDEIVRLDEVRSHKWSRS